MWLICQPYSSMIHRRPTVIDHLPTPLLHRHMCIHWRLVHIWFGWEDHYSVPTRGDLDWFLLLDSVDGELVLGIWPENSERCTANISRDPGVVKTYISATAPYRDA